MLQCRHFFEAKVNHQVLRLQSLFLFDSLLQLRTTAQEITPPKPDLDAKAEQSMILKVCNKTFNKQITSTSMEKICRKITIATFMQPCQYDLQRSAAKDESITHASVALRNLDAAIAVRFAAPRRKPRISQST